MSTMTSASKDTAAVLTADELLAHDGWSRDQLLSYQRDRLRELLQHAVARSPYYRARLGRDALATDLRLRDLPTLPKATLMEQFDAVRIVLRSDAAADTSARVHSRISDALREAGALLPPIEIERVDAIEREPGGAKLKLVKTVGSAERGA